MIVKMKKITLFQSAKDRDSTVSALRQLGVLHIHDIKVPASDDIQSIENKIENVDRALRIIPAEDVTQETAAPDQASSYAEQILELAQEQENLARELEEQQETHRWFEKWGAVSFASVQQLKEVGVFIRFYVSDKNALKALPKDKTIQVAKEDQGTVYLALISDEPEERLDLKEENIPQLELDTLESRMNETEQRITKIDSAIKDLAKTRDALTAYRTDLDKQLEFNNVKYGMGEIENIVYLQGFCPVDVVANIEKRAEKEGWGYVIQEPDDPNETPTLIRIPKWLKIINPVFQFMGAKPGYDEYDISLWFLIFFSIFFAMLVGDGGYGLIFILAAFLISKRKKNTVREPIRLMYLLGGATVFWGAVSGNWFGYEGFARLPLLNFMVVDHINSFVAANQGFMMYLSFIIGVIHLTIARLMAVVKYINSLKAVAELGWIAVLWSLFLLAGDLVLGKPLPGITLPVFAAGLLCVLLFSNLQKHFIAGILQTLTELPLKVIGSFSDVVSYLRLFAVGYATVIVASSINGIALDYGFGSLFSGLISAVILFIGHAINIMLALMAVIVHGVRLNMLEFSGHLNMQWSGKNFNPFK